MNHQTLKYYDDNAQDFFNGTAGAHMDALYQPFEAHLAPGMHILDLGCGSGRDSRYFLKKGYRVTAADGAEALCRLASDFIGQRVQHLQFEELSFCEEFDAVWACASLLHVEQQQMPAVLQRVFRSLKPQGILYASYKYGTTQHVEKGRLFCDYTEEDLGPLFSQIPAAVVKTWWISHDVREDREGERWLNIIAEKK